jgi:MoxR-like ATPase
MNPPVTPDSDPDEAYEGSLPLDPALADRFSYVVALPALADLTSADRLALIGRGGALPESLPDLAGLVEQTRREIAATVETDRAWTVKYVDALVSPLAECRLAISGRRAVMLAGGIASIRAASRVLGSHDELEDCALAMLRAGLPQRAQGRPIEASKLTAIHRSAAQQAGEAEGTPMRTIRKLPNAVARVAEGLRLLGKGVDKTQLSTLVSEAFAQLPLPRRYLFASHVLPLAAACDGLNAPAYDLLAAPMAKVAAMCAQRQHSIAASRSEMPRWNELSKRIARLGRGDAHEVRLGNLFLTLALVEKELFDADALIALDAEWRALFQGHPDEREAA